MRLSSSKTHARNIEEGWRARAKVDSFFLGNNHHMDNKLKTHMSRLVLDRVAVILAPMVDQGSTGIIFD